MTIRMSIQGRKIAAKNDGESTEHLACWREEELGRHTVIAKGLKRFFFRSRVGRRRCFSSTAVEQVRRQASAETRTDRAEKLACVFLSRTREASQRAPSAKTCQTGIQAAQALQKLWQAVSTCDGHARN